MTPELRIDCADDRKFAVMEKLQAVVAQNYAPEEINTIDGVRVTSTIGWWLIRASNTEAALVARAEAISPATLKQLTSEIQAALADADLSWSFD